jgi:hypothetical protein
MRDIRPDLRERLKSVLIKRQSHQKALDNLAAEEQLLTKMLQSEDAMFEVPSTLFDAAEDVGPAQPTAPLSEVLIETLKAHSGSASLDELKEGAAQRRVPFGGKQPGRVIHFAMLGMAQHRLVDRKDDGRWFLVEEPIN